MRFFNNTKGFTLVELMVGMTVLVITLAAIFGVLSVSVKAFQYNSSKGHVTSQAGTAITVVTQQIRYATSLTGLALGASASTLTFKDPSHTYVIAIGTGTDAKTLLITKDGIISNRLAPGMVKSITFSRDNSSSHLLTVSITFNDDLSSMNQDIILTNLIFMPNITS